MWRLTEFNNRYIKLTQKYLDECIDDIIIRLDQEVKNEKIFDNWLTFTETKTTKAWRLKVKLPSIEWLAKYLWVARSTIYKWKDEQEEFSDILDKILQEQAERLINMWLSWRI